MRLKSICRPFSDQITLCDLHERSPRARSDHMPLPPGPALLHRPHISITTIVSRAQVCVAHSGPPCTRFWCAAGTDQSLLASQPTTAHILHAHTPQPTQRQRPTPHSRADALLASLRFPARQCHPTHPNTPNGPLTVAFRFAPAPAPARGKQRGARRRRPAPAAVGPPPPSPSSL